MVDAHIRFLKISDFKSYTLSYNKHAKFNSLGDIIQLLLVKISKKWGKCIVGSIYSIIEQSVDCKNL